MQSKSLKKFIDNTHTQLLERINELKDKLLSTNEHFNDKDSADLAVAEGQLKLIKDIIKIYQNKKEN